MEKYTYNDIKNKILYLRKSQNDVVSNFIPLMDSGNDDNYEGFSTDKSIVFLHEEGRTRRATFFSGDRSELIYLLSLLPKGIAADYIARSETVDDDFMLKAGFRKKGLLERISFPDIQQEKEILLQDPQFKALYDNGDFCDVEYAVTGDEYEIYKNLSEIFNIYVDHLETEKEILAHIEKKGIIICRKDYGIAALEIYNIHGSKMEITNVFNKDNYRVMCALDVKIREIARENSVKYMYTFVDLYNERAVRYHNRRNAIFEKFYNHIYAKE